MRTFEYKDYRYEFNSDDERNVFMIIFFICIERNKSIKANASTIARISKKSYIEKNKKAYKSFYLKYDCLEVFNYTGTKVKSILKKLLKNGYIKIKKGSTCTYMLADPIKEIKCKKRIDIPPKKLPPYSFSYEYFLNMAPWSIKADHVKRKDEYLVKTKTDFDFYVDSSYELNLFNRLNKDSSIIDIRGQNLAIPYGKKIHYYPDFAIYYNDGIICLYEVKPVILMASHTVLKKFSVLEKYAIKNGYDYNMGGIVKNTAPIIDIKKIIDKKVNPSFKKYVDEIISSNNALVPEDLDKYAKEHKLVGSQKNQLEYYLASIIINDLDNYYMYSRSGKNPFNWRVIHPKYKNHIKLKILSKKGD